MGQVRNRHPLHDFKLFSSNFSHPNDPTLPVAKWYEPKIVYHKAYAVAHTFEKNLPKLKTLNISHVGVVNFVGFGIIKYRFIEESMDLKCPVDDFQKGVNLKAKESNFFLWKKQEQLDRKIIKPLMPCSILVISFKSGSLFCFQFSGQDLPFIVFE